MKKLYILFALCCNYLLTFKDNLKYPTGAVKNKIEGNVGVQFEVTSSGQLSNFNIVKILIMGMLIH